MRANGGVRVVPFSPNEDVTVDPTGPRLMSWRDFYAFRNELVHILQKYGSVGPMGAMSLLEDRDSSCQAWECGAADPDFYVTPDMWNEYDRCVEVNSRWVPRSLLDQLVGMLQRQPEWCVYIVLKQAALTIFSDRILHEGELFTGAGSIEELENAAAG